MAQSIEYLKMQIEIHKMHAMRAHAEIVSGHYKQAQTQRGVEGGGWRDLTDDEKLHKKVIEMESHIRFMTECSETFYDLEQKNIEARASSYLLRGT